MPLRNNAIRPIKPAKRRIRTAAKREADIYASCGTSTSPKRLIKSANVFTRTSSRMMSQRKAKDVARSNDRKSWNSSEKDTCYPSRKNQSEVTSPSSSPLRSLAKYFAEDILVNLRHSAATIKKKKSKLQAKKRKPIPQRRVSTLVNYDEREAERERIRRLYFGKDESKITDIFNPWVIAHGRQQVKKRMHTSHRGQSKIKRDDTYSEEFDYSLGKLAGKAKASWRKKKLLS
mmetsp:Transcript_31810/g.44519  ORF Transcript_31810/g.44519 Transcript_31810/m.44519 type:complete len:232 (-) Transcript_31810:102-797(-)